MESLQSALYSVFILSLLASLYRMLGRRKQSTQAPMLLVVVCIAALILPPLLQGSFEFDTFFVPPVEEGKEGDEWERALCAQTERELAAALTQGLTEQFGLRADTFAVEAEIARAQGTFSLRCVTVRLRAQDSYMKKDVSAYVKEQTNSSVRVETNYGEGEESA